MKPWKVDALLFVCAVAFTTLAAWCGGAEFGTQPFGESMIGGAIAGLVLVALRVICRID